MPCRSLQYPLLPAAKGNVSHGSVLNENYAPTRVTSGWKSTIEAERADLCCSILGIALGDVLVQSQKGQITRIQVSRTSMNITENRSFFIVEGPRFRKDGTAGKRTETIWIDF
jgi:hypothetical protein